jgi:short-subunit dehydrogenase
MTKIPPRAKTALVTGASSGIGLAAATALAQAGYHVIGTSRSARVSSERIRMITCDVRSDESVAAATELARSELGRIDLLVNNAGIGLIGAAEESSLPQIEALFQTNYFGVVRVTNAVLPLMRSQGGGRILNVGSAVGFIPAPYMAHYAATKHALEGYTESLDHELREFGIRASVVEPAYTQTSFESGTEHADMPQLAYDASRAKHRAALEVAFASGDSAQSVGQTIVRAALAKSPRLRYPAGKVARSVGLARRFAPVWLFDKVLRAQSGLTAPSSAPPRLGA